MNRFELSKAYQKAAKSAREQEEILFPSQAMDLLKSSYGNRIENIKGTTLYKMIYHLGLYNGTEMEKFEIWKSINEFMFKEFKMEPCITDHIHYQDSFEYTVEFTNAEGKRVEDTVTLSKPYLHVADVFEWIERKHLVCDNMEITEIYIDSFPC